MGITLLDYGDQSQTDFLESARVLFREYEAYLEVDLCFQDFGRELAELPGLYSAPEGALTLAYADDRLAGCVAVRPRESGVAEMKRLYVRPGHRGRGLGLLLAKSAVAFAANRGYQRMVLDTLDRLTPAIALYRSLGFVEIPPYYGNPLEGVMYFSKALNV